MIFVIILKKMSLNPKIQKLIEEIKKINGLKN